MASLSTICRFFTALFVWFPMLVNAQSVKPTTWADAKKNKEAIIVVNYIQTPMFSYSTSQKDKPKGICVDLMDNFAKYLELQKGIKITVIYRPYEDFVKFYETTKNAPSGTFGIGNITITEARKKEVKFSPPFISNTTVLLTHNSVPTLRKMELLGKDFAGMTAYTVRGTTNAQRIEMLKKQYMPEMQIKYLSSSIEAIQAIAQDPKGFTNLDFVYYNDAIRDKMPIKRHPVGDFTAEDFGIMMPMASDWLPAMQDFFAIGGRNYRNSAEYRASLNTHLGETAVRLLESIQKRQ
ncbi:MAG: transporter substrate-binding domain-containing protein [Cytophagales bacterium]|nr:transporter substrate-binding domain-containing protein [Bernardetiaceae bacterium]MDW8203850.1 transporter substrate-binding domain-containing protein [Cytophagales bacterium]